MKCECAMSCVKTTTTKICVAILIASFAWGTSAAQTYVITRIGDEEARDIRAFDINESGRVVGLSSIDGIRRAFLYDDTQLVHLAGLREGDGTAAFAINNNNQIVGESFDSTTSTPTAVLWDSERVIDVGSQFDAAISVARDINDSGVIVGQAALELGPFTQGFIWDEVNGGQIVGTLDGRSGGVNRSVNERGVVVGHSFFFGSPDQAHVVTEMDGRYITELISAPFPGIGVAAAVNDHNVIVGHANTTFGPHTAAIFTPGQPELFIDLGTLPGATESEAFDVNDDGIIVGAAGGYPDWSTAHAFVFRNGRMLDLNDLFDDPMGEWDVLIQATAVNNNGDIVGFGRTSDGNTSAFILAVPEPATTKLFALGLLAVRIYSQRLRRHESIAVIGHGILKRKRS